jgi:hypothetical protein
MSTMLISDWLRGALERTGKIYADGNASRE